MAPLAAILFPVFAQARLAAQRTQALTSLKGHGVGLLVYASDYDDRLPLASNWEPAATANPSVKPIVSDAFGNSLPQARTTMNMAAAGTALTVWDTPAQSALQFFSAKTTPNATGGLEDVQSLSSKVAPIGLLDASARAVPQNEVTLLIWNKPLAQE